MAEDKLFEIEVRVSAPGQRDAVAHREYRAVSHESTDGAVKEIMDGFTTTTKERLTPVNDAR